MAYVIDQVENDLLACLCEALADEGRPVCDCFAYPGGEIPPMDTCGRVGNASGQAWLSRLGAQWEPQQKRATWAGGYCGSQNWSTAIDLGVYRCSLSVPDESGNVDKTLYPFDRELMNADSQTLLRSVMCCPVWADSDGAVSLVSATLERLEPQGGCMGVVLQIVVAMDLAASVSDAPAEEVWVSAPAG